MTEVFYLLLTLGFLGSFDVVYYHTYICNLDDKTASIKEAFIHKLRYPVYGFLFIAVANFQLNGLWSLAPLSLMLLDIAISIIDVIEEPDSRNAQGGMPRGEYLLHFIFALLLGAFYLSYVRVVIGNFALPTSIAVSSLEVPLVFRLFMNYMAIRAFSLLFLPIKIPNNLLKLFSKIEKETSIIFK